MADIFDLDEALTMDDYISFSNVSVNTQDPELLSPEEARDEVSGMPTVVPALGVCTVCLESLYSSCKQAPCGHLYHADCITQWLLFRNSCPICRSKVLGHREKVPVSPPAMKFD
ncbi:hypothetical protein E3N88_06041 [Mikania micrantha]|uniref:RING-type E3 ubiquitin transferase n=1 Tax=Mikania micrantha TaxID=192012 RepID=A0A5N6PPI7_9ASTR|nr:hypothetical protein E3N88_06041 [Mikania micrantha]